MARKCQRCLHEWGGSGGQPDERVNARLATRFREAFTFNLWGGGGEKRYGGVVGLCWAQEPGGALPLCCGEQPRTSLEEE